MHLQTSILNFFQKVGQYEQSWKVLVSLHVQASGDSCLDS